MIKRKETNKIIGAQLLVSIILAALVLLWAMLAWAIDTEIGGGQGSSTAVNTYSSKKSKIFLPR